MQDDIHWKLPATQMMLYTTLVFGSMIVAMSSDDEEVSIV